MAATLDQWAWVRPISQSEDQKSRQLEDDISGVVGGTKELNGELLAGNMLSIICSEILLVSSHSLLSGCSDRQPAQQSLVPTRLAAVLAAEQPANER